jgi:hypothetical protein
MNSIIQKFLNIRTKFCLPGIKSYWINTKGKPASAHSLTDYVQSTCFQECGKFATPIDFRRYTLSNAVYQYLQGDGEKINLERICLMLNTSVFVATENYNLYDLIIVGDKVMEERIDGIQNQKLKELIEAGSQEQFEKR